MAGLSAGWMLERLRLPYLLVESEETVGGLCRSLRRGGYLFDYSGHLLCFQKDEIRLWIQEICQDQWRAFERRAAIYIEEKLVPFPFQAHLGALPEPIMRECLGEAVLTRLEPMTDPAPHSWKDWIQRKFGRGIAKHFFFPYHAKLWGTPLEDLWARGLEWSVPSLSLKELVDGALGGTNPRMGYNALFYYPSQGGIETLPKALAQGLSRIKTGCALREVRWREKVAVLQNGEEIRYERLLASIPLPRLVESLSPEVPPIRNAAQGLRCADIWVINIGVSREGVSEHHWIYFPEGEYPFFRIGCYTAFGPHLAPKGCSSLYVEVPGHWIRSQRCRDWIGECLDGLVRSGLLRGRDEVDCVEPIHIPFAYVIFDRYRHRVLNEILLFLEAQGIHMMGRYGRWGYGTMEGALCEGRQTALRVVS